jgi:hypothetical protein
LPVVVNLLHTDVISPGYHPTAAAQRRMLGMRADIREVLPAAGAFVIAGFRHNGGEVVP